MLVKAVVNRLKSVLLPFSRKILTAEVRCYLMETGGFELVNCYRHENLNMLTKMQLSERAQSSVPGNQ